MFFLTIAIVFFITIGNIKQLISLQVVHNEVMVSSSTIVKAESDVFKTTSAFTGIRRKHRFLVKSKILV